MIGILYSCPGCGLKDVVAELPTRPEGEDVLVWMKKVEAALSRDHDRRSPGCHPDNLKNVKIPLEGRAHVGGPMEH